MTLSRSSSAIDAAQRVRASNRRVAWTLASIAAVFFAGIIATRWMGGGTAGIGVMGAAVLLFLVVAIGRNLLRAGESAGANDASALPDAQQRDGPGAAGEAQR